MKKSDNNNCQISIYIHICDDQFTAYLVERIFLYFRVVYTPQVPKVVEKFGTDGSLQNVFFVSRCQMVCTRCFDGKPEFEQKPLLIFAAGSCQGKFCAKWFKFSRQKT